jgi:hypothetical protein
MEVTVCLQAAQVKPVQLRSKYARLNNKCEAGCPRSCFAPSIVSSVLVPRDPEPQNRILNPICI